MLSDNQKEAIRTPYMYLERTAEATGVIRTVVACIRREKSERGRFVIPDGSEEGAIYVRESFDKAAIRHNTILHCEETVADSKYYLFNPL